MKLGKRLEHLKSLVGTHYDHIWDCCCDHGFLGSALLADKIAPHIHFVDVVPELMQELNEKLQRFFPQPLTESVSSQWHLHCLDVAQLPLADFAGKHLVIIAGVGGNLISEFVSAIRKAHPTLELDFLLCPVLHQYRLRQELMRWNMRLLSEQLMRDKQRYYEMILVSTAPHVGIPLSVVGELIWHANTDEQRNIVAGYLRKTLAHYRRVQLGDDPAAEKIIADYASITL